MSWDENLAEPVSWSYVAGFTDGEGHIAIKKANTDGTSFGIVLYQNIDADWVLHEIQMFLAEHEIDARLYEAKRPKDSRHPTVGMYLSIRRVRDVYRFLENTLPYLIVKRPAAIRVLKAIERKAETTGRSGYYDFLKEGN